MGGGGGNSASEKRGGSRGRAEIIRNHLTGNAEATKKGKKGGV